MSEGFQLRVARRFVFVIAGAALLGVVAVMALLYEKTTIDCTRARGEDGVCVVVQRRVFGTSTRRLPASAIRNASIDVSTSQRAGTSSGHTDTTFVLDLADGSAIRVDDLAIAFLDRSFERSDAQAIDRFIADKTIERTHAVNGGLASMLAIIGGLAALAGALAWMWGFASIEIARDGDVLKVTGEGGSRHPIEGVTDVGIDAAYRSLRVHYRDGTSQQTARLGVSAAQLADLARRTRALLGLA